MNDARLPMKSMTGAGFAHFADAFQSFSVQLRSINGRFFDLQLQIPVHFRHLETKIRDYLRGSLHRGSVELNITHVSQKRNVRVQEELVQAIRDALEESGIAMQLQLRDLYELGGIHMQELVSEEDEQLCMRLVSEAAAECLRYQEQEGAAMYAIIRKQIESFAALIARLQEHTKTINAQIEERLNQRVESLTQLSVDTASLHSVLASLLIKASITEEVDRLRVNVDQFFNTIDDPNIRKGKKLEFMCQEFVRETNTIGAKLPFACENDTIVSLKCLIEDMREQIRNIA